MIIWALACWGQHHAELLTRFHVPAMLLPGNLDALRAFGPVECHIYTRPGDELLLADAVRPLEQANRPTFIMPVADWPEPPFDRHQQMAKLQKMAVKDAVARGAGLAWTYPDIVMPEGQYASLGSPRALEREGIGCILGRFPSLDGSHHRWKLGGCIPADPSRFAAELYQDDLLHPMMQCCVVHADGPHTTWPHAFWWKVPGGFVCHALHIDTLLCWPTKESPFGHPLDSGFIQHATFARPEIIVAKRFTAAEIGSPKHYAIDGPALSVPGVAKWAHEQSTRRGIAAFQQQLLVGDAEFQPEPWKYAQSVAREALASPPDKPDWW